MENINQKDQIILKIQQALDTIRPHLKVDGGNVEFVELTEDNRVKIRWTGMCETCNMSAMTLKAGIQEAIKAHVPEIVSVEAINGVHAV